MKENGLLVERKIYKAKRRPTRSLSADRPACPRLPAGRGGQVP